MNGLAQTLAVKSKLAENQYKQEETEKFEMEKARAKQTALRINKTLPQFLDSLTLQGCNWAYIVELNNYLPYDFQYPHYRSYTFNSNSLSRYKIQKYLFGVPRHVSDWAIREGFRVSVGYWSITSLERHVFEIEKFGRPTGQGIILRW
jgi:hypothetical protein